MYVSSPWCFAFPSINIVILSTSWSVQRRSLRREGFALSYPSATSHFISSNPTADQEQEVAALPPPPAPAEVAANPPEAAPPPVVEHEVIFFSVYIFTSAFPLPFVSFLVCYRLYYFGQRNWSMYTCRILARRAILYSLFEVWPGESYF